MVFNSSSWKEQQNRIEKDLASMPSRLRSWEQYEHWLDGKQKEVDLYEADVAQVTEGLSDSVEQLTEVHFRCYAEFS